MAAGFVLVFLEILNIREPGIFMENSIRDYEKRENRLFADKSFMRLLHVG